MPSRMIHELARIIGARVDRILAGHFDVTAERDRGDAVVGLAPAEAEQARTEADGKNLNPHSQPLGYGEVAELMDQNHEAQHRDDVEIVKPAREIRHNEGTFSSVG